MSFTIVLILSAIISSLVLIFAIHFVNERNFYIIKNNKFAALVLFTSVLSLLSLIIYSGFNIGPRTQLWFIMQSISMGTIIILMLTRKIYSFYVLTVPLLITILTPTAIIFAQGTSIIGSDQWRDYVATQSIIMDGNYWRASEFSPIYNKPAPIMEILIATFSMITGLILFHSFTILTIIFPLLGVLVLYRTTYRIINDRFALAASSIFVLSNPMINLWLVSHHILGSLYSLLFFNIFLQSYKSHNTLSSGNFYALLLLALVTIIQHGSPTIGIFLVVVVAVFLTLIKVKNEGIMKSNLHFLLKFLLLLIIITLIYWIWAIVFKYIISIQLNLMKSTLASPGSIQMPALQMENTIVALSYSIPAAFASAYVYRYFLNVLNKRKEKYINGIFTFSAIMGGILLILGFLSFYNAGGWSDTRYIGAPGYLLLLVSAIICFSLLVRKGKWWVKLIAISLGMLMFFSSSFSAAWAPDQYDTTTTRFHDIYSQNVALSLVKLVPDGSMVTAVRGVDDPFYSISALYGKSFNINLEFTHLLFFQKGFTLEPNEIIKFIKPNQLLILDAETIQPLLVHYPNINIYYTSGLYYVISGY
jgi:hypothetical protein